MIAHLTQARSYAKAIFGLALSQQKLNEWQKVLEVFAQIVLACKESDILANPQIPEAQKIALFTEVANKLSEALNLVKLLIRRRKIAILPEIAANYQQLFFTYTKTLEVKIVSAEELTSLQKEQMLNALSKRHQCTILLQCEVDSKLIGGAIVYMQDQVIDGSIKGMLQRLKQCLLLKNAYAKT